MRASDLPPIQIDRASARSANAQLALFLATTLNTRDMGMQPAQSRGGEPWMLRSTLMAMGVKPDVLGDSGKDGEDWIAIKSIPGAQVQFENTRQALVLNLPFSHLSWASTEITTNQFSAPSPSSTPGMLVNYDLFGYGTSQSRSLSASTEMRLFRSNMVLSNTMLTRYTENNQSAAMGNSQSQFSNVRLDSTYSYSFPDEMLTLRLGDTLTRSVPWSRATRIGGIQLSRNFGLQPYRTTAPIPALMGTSAVPSDISLFINGIKQYQGNVPAGPFTLNAPTGLVGTGNAQVLLTDALGRSTTLQFNFYGTNQLLAKGLSDWSVEFGWVRRNYGNSSFDYASDPAASGSWNYGLTDQLTVQTHAEATTKLLNAGAGAAWKAGGLGVLTAGTAYSHNDKQSGVLGQVGYNWSNENLFTNLQATRANEGYRDTASLYDAARMKSSGRAIMGFSTPALGNFNLGVVYLRNFGQEPQRYATFGWSRSLSSRGYVNLSVNRNLDDNRLSNVQLQMSWFLDNRMSVGSTVSHQDGNTRVSAYADQRAPSEGGWGWSTQAQSGNGGSGQARVEYIGANYEANAIMARNGNSTTAGLGASGALIWMDGHTFASRSVYDSFAVVSTAGVPNVPIKRENVLVGKTNEDGVMLVPQIGAYRSNKISIDPMDLPAQMRVPEVDHVIVPTDRSGVLVSFALQRIRSATILLHSADGKPLPVGALVTAVDANASGDIKPQSSMIGYDGASYFDSLAANNLLRVYLPNGSRCEVRVALPDTQPNEVPLVGPVTCRSF